MNYRMISCAVASLCAGRLFAAVAIPVIQWAPGDHNRPQPAQVAPGTFSTQAQPGTPPSDAAVLFDGADLSAWQHSDGKPADWSVRDGYFEVKARSGDIDTKRAFGDCQLHVEWAAPDAPRGSDQTPGNSGVYLMTLYEIQVLESFKNRTYPDGQAGSVYCQYPPLVNASLPPRVWQTYDIVFHGPRFSSSGELTRLATVTLLHNGVLVRDHVSLTGPTDWLKRPPYKAHAAKMPLRLQDHGQPARFRNIWIREIPEPEQ
jgi:hypothetical protein